MSRTPRYFSKASAYALGLALAAYLSAAAHAAGIPINYGNFGPIPPGLVFLGVTETANSLDDVPPLYGAPDPYTTGLDFDPKGFVAASVGGGADLTDGQLNFTIMDTVALPNVVGIDAISLFEGGDYTLAGGGGGATSVAAGATMIATVLEMNGVPVAPFNLTQVSASFGDALPGNAIVAPWSLGLLLDVGAQLTGLGFGPNDRATKIEIAINNTLLAQSAPGGVAFIAKKDFRLDIVPDPGIVPEPGTLALAGLALCGLAAGRKRA